MTAKIFRISANVTARECVVEYNTNGQPTGNAWVDGEKFVNVGSEVPGIPPWISVLGGTTSGGTVTTKTLNVIVTNDVVPKSARDQMPVLIYGQIGSGSGGATWVHTY